jgi:hypothetical protein
MDACSQREAVQHTAGGFDSETTAIGGNEVFRQYDERGRLVVEVTVAARAAETRVYDYADALRGQQ